MPEHVDLLFGEPERGNPSLVMVALKQTLAGRVLRQFRAKTNPQQGLWRTPVEEGHIWQRRFYDFVVFSEKNREAPVHASKSGGAWTGAGAAAVELGQLPPLCL